MMNQIQVSYACMLLCIIVGNTSKDGLCEMLGYLFACLWGISCICELIIKWRA